MDLIENQDQKLNEVFLMYADQVCKNKLLNNNQCIEQYHEFFNFIFEDIKGLIKERNEMIYIHNIIINKKTSKLLGVDKQELKNKVLNKVNINGDFIIKCLLCDKQFDGDLMKQWYKLSKTCPSCKSQHLEYKVEFIYSKCFIKAEYKKQMNNFKNSLFLDD